MGKTVCTAPAVVLVDDETEILFSYEVMLLGSGLTNIVTMSDSRELLPYLAGNDAGVVVLDLQMPHLSGAELLAALTANYPHVPVIIVTAANELNTAVSCMKNGAFDYQIKPVDVGRLESSIRKALEISALRSEISSLRESLLSGRVRNADAFAEIITRSPKMQSIFSYLEAAAVTEQPVLITGETGVGKDLVARAVHTLSGRSGKFVAINSGGLDDQMFADTLFGHRRGAFTGAAESREGMISRAAGGTLFLDEIGDLSTASQIKLLRLLQEGEYYPLGSDTPLRSSARIVVATNQGLERLLATGAFRKDLYYRLCSHHVSIPPLRERREDIPLLLESFLREAAASLQKELPAYRPELFTYLATYHFPGNIRELKALVFDAMTQHRGGNLSIASFRFTTGAETPARESSPEFQPAGRDFQLSGRFPMLKEMEEYLIAEALRLSGGNQGAAALLLGITRQALNKRLCRK